MVKTLFICCVKIILIIYVWDRFFNFMWKGRKSVIVECEDIEVDVIIWWKCLSLFFMDFYFVYIYKVDGRVIVKIRCEFDL